MVLCSLKHACDTDIYAIIIINMPFSTMFTKTRHLCDAAFAFPVMSSTFKRRNTLLKEIFFLLGVGPLLGRFRRNVMYVEVEPLVLNTNCNRWSYQMDVMLYNNVKIHSD